MAGTVLSDIRHYYQISQEEAALILNIPLEVYRYLEKQENINRKIESLTGKLIVVSYLFFYSKRDFTKV
ncbi:hypothetical protein [Enterococcus olivae]